MFRHLVGKHARAHCTLDRDFIDGSAYRGHARDQPEQGPARRVHEQAVLARDDGGRAPPPGQKAQLPEEIARAKGRLTASAKVDLVADLYAAWGLFSHRWTYNVASASAQIGPELKLTLGRIAYAKDGEITWPSLSQIRAEPESIDPLAVVKEMLGRGEAKET